jgi:hypothetical protein
MHVNVAKLMNDGMAIQVLSMSSNSLSITHLYNMICDIRHTNFGKNAASNNAMIANCYTQHLLVTANPLGA